MKRRFGNSLLLLSVIITFVLWLLSKNVAPISSEPIKFLSQISGLIGTLLFALGFILATRVSILEKLFGGLDKVYQVHHGIGVLSYTLLLLHPILLLISSGKISLLPTYLFPSNSIQYTFGVLALYLLTLHIITTIYLKLPYHIWKKIHVLIGFPLLLGILHSLTISSDISRYLPLRLWIFTFLLFAFFSYIYKEFLYKYLGKRFTYNVLSKIVDGNIIKLRLSPLSKKLDFKPGQFVFISFPNSKLGNESHPFSITSIPNDDFIELGIKKLGDYTENIETANIGDIAEIHGPYGVFGENDFTKVKKTVFLAAGIGITPFISLTKSLVEKKINTDITLIYLCKNKNEVYFKDELDSFSKSNIKVVYYFSDENGPFESRYLTELIANDIDDCFVYMCAPPKLLKKLEDSLLKYGVAQKNIIFEQFDIK